MFCAHDPRNIRNAGRTLEDDETGKPTVVNGEHLDPYNVTRWRMVQDLWDADVFLAACSPWIAFNIQWTKHDKTTA